jgi:ketosteroid isomerase-like protein
VESTGEHVNAQIIRRLYDARAEGDLATVRAILDSDVAWHDPYPPPHGGDLRGVDAVLRDVFEAAGHLTGGSTRLWIESVMATGRHAVALVGWSSSFRGRTMQSREVAVYEIRNGRITEAWFYPEDPEGARRFFE